MKPAATYFLLGLSLVCALILPYSRLFVGLILAFVTAIYIWIKPSLPLPIESTEDDNDDPTSTDSTASTSSSLSSSSKVRTRPSPTRRNVCTDRFSSSKLVEESSIDVIVIGAGLSGLSCAAMLSRMGYRVIVLEQHDIIGGGSHTFNLGSKAQYRFDSGLHYCIPECAQLLQLCTGSELPPVEIPKMGVSLKNTNMLQNGQGEGMLTYDRVVFQDQLDQPFDFMLNEAHLPSLYARFPLPADKQAIDQWRSDAARAVDSIPRFVLSKLFPQSWRRHIAPYLLGDFHKFASLTTEQYFAKLTPNRRLASLLGSLWIDTGSAPHKASFMMTAAVVFGFPKRGGAFPQGGPQEMSKSLVPTIERNGGRVFVRADVRSIVLRKNENTKSFEASGVELSNGQRLQARYGVVSSVGYLNTFTRLLSSDRSVLESLQIPTSFPKCPNSLGFVMINIGISGASVSELGIANYNVWHLPCSSNGDMYESLHEFWKDPLRSPDQLPMMITFPSLNGHRNEEPTVNGVIYHTCQILLTAEYEWFKQWSTKGKSGAANTRGDDYEAFKKKWADLSLQKLYQIYPRVKKYVDFVDVSTPLSIEHYLREPEGGACGLDLVPERFTNQAVQDACDVVTKIPNLYLTGQDTLICGQPLVQLAGIITAFRMTSFLQSVRVVLQSIFCTIPE